MIRPSVLEIMFSVPGFIKLSFANTIISIAASREIGISFHIVLPCTFNGAIIPVMPKMKRRLKLLLPITLPSTIPLASPFREAKVLTKSSGREVPNPITTRPITNSDIPYFLANVEHPSISQFDPKVSIPKPLNNKKIDSITFVNFYLNILRKFTLVFVLKLKNNKQYFSCQRSLGDQ